MKKIKLKRIISSLLTVAMLLSCVANVSAFEYNDGVLVGGLDQTDDKQIPTLSLELFKVGDDWEDTYGDNKGKLVALNGSEPISTTTSDIITNMNSDGKFIVGIVAHNFDNFTGVSTTGFRQAAIGVAYDPNYLQLEPSTVCLDEFGDINDTYGMLYSQRTGSVDKNWRFGSYFQAAVSVKDIKPEAGLANNITDNAAIVIQPFNNGTRRYKMGNKVYMGFIEFKLIKNDEDDSRPSIISFSKSGEDLNMTFAESESYTYNSTIKNLANYLALDTKEVDFFGSGMPKLERLTYNDTVYTSIPDQYIGETFNPNRNLIDNLLKLTAYNNDGNAVTPGLTFQTDGVSFVVLPDEDSKNEDYWKGLANDVDALKEQSGAIVFAGKQMPTVTGANWPADSTKHLYAVYENSTGKAAVYINSFRVKKDKITNVELHQGNTLFGDTGHTYFASESILGVLTRESEKLEVHLKYDDTAKGEDVVVYEAASGSDPADSFTKKGIALFVVNKDGVLEKVPSNQKTFADYIADMDAEDLSLDFYVGVDETERVLAGKTPAAVAGDDSLKNLITEKITAKIQKKQMVILTFDDGNGKALAPSYFSYATEGTHVDNKNTRIFNVGDGYVQVYFTDKDEQHPEAPVKFGNLSAEDLKDYTIYAEAKGASTSDRFTNSNGQIELKSGVTEITDEMIGRDVYIVPTKNPSNDPKKPYKIGTLTKRAISIAEADLGTDGYPVSGQPHAAKHGQTLDEFEMTIDVVFDNGDTVTLTVEDFIKEGGELQIDGKPIDADELLTREMNGKVIDFVYKEKTIGSSLPLGIDKKVLKVTADASGVTISKTYNNSPAVDADDTAALNGTLALVVADDNKIATEDEALYAKVDLGGLTFEYEDKTADPEKPVSYKGTVLAVATDAEGSAEAVAAINNKYDFVLDDGVFTSLKGAIIAKPITVTSLDVPWVYVKDYENKKKVVPEEELTPAKADGIYEDDTVKLTYQYEYTNIDAASKTAPVTITWEGEGLGLSGTDSRNYEIVDITVATGEVRNKNIKELEVTGLADNNTYTYPNNKLDLGALKVKIIYEGMTPEEIAAAPALTMEQFLTDGGSVKLGDAAITIDDLGVKTLAYGTVDLVFNYENDGTKAPELPEKLIVKKKQIKLSDIDFTIEKDWDGVKKSESKDYDNWYNFVEDPNEEGDNIGITFTVEFENTDASDTKTKADITELTITGDGKDNYEIVDEDGNPVTSTVDEALIKKKATDKPDTPVNKPKENVDSTKSNVEIDPSTNHIVVTPPDDEYEYQFSFDGGEWSDSPESGDLAQGKDVTVRVRRKPIDNNHDYSEPSDALTVKTFKNYVEVYKTKTDPATGNKLGSGYTNETTVNSDAEVHAVLVDGKPSGFKAYYTDQAGTEKIEYPYTLGEKTVLFMTKTSGGGSSGPGITITFDPSSYEGYVGDTITLNPTITGSTSKPTWKSSNESLATVDENGKVTLLKEGQVKITATVNGVMKSVVVTIKPAPVVTPVPTDKPLINDEYTKPYASGYEDGSFRPDNNITRAELAAMIARLINGDDIPATYSSSFFDVPADIWYNKYVGYLEAYNVLSGYEDGSFRPENPVTRGEICAVITRAQRYDLISVDGMFTDVTAADWAKDYITTLARLSIVTGYVDGSFLPYGQLTRAEAVTMINNVLAPSTPVVTFNPFDIAGHWAEANIILAVNERKLNSPSVPESQPEDATEPEGVVDTTVVDGEDNTEVADGETANDENAEDGETEDAADGSEETPAE
ncbi:MAG: S-layer homology domain-containing protein [Oscillospiraceae bacterium]|nr:S-layer homology domain-containing protein [Oscillospiraceae bacterium]